MKTFHAIALGFTLGFASYALIGCHAETKPPAVTIQAEELTDAEYLPNPDNGQTNADTFTSQEDEEDVGSGDEVVA